MRIHSRAVHTSTSDAPDSDRGPNSDDREYDNTTSYALSHTSVTALDPLGPAIDALVLGSQLVPERTRTQCTLSGKFLAVGAIWNYSSRLRPWRSLTTVRLLWCARSA